jgi:predicted RNase H-like nuclease (RuvC/YqgF family)
MRAASTALLLALALCCLVTAGQAQTASPARLKAGDGGDKISSLGSAKPGGKLLSREELRACLAQQSELATRKSSIEVQGEKLQAERQALQQADAALKTERDAVDRLGEEAARLNKRFQDQSAQVDDFNDRVARFQDSGRSGPTAERQRNELEREKQALEASALALEAERSALKPKTELALTAYNTRGAVRDKSAADWNARNALYTQSAQAYETDREKWSVD